MTPPRYALLLPLLLGLFSAPSHGTGTTEQTIDWKQLMEPLSVCTDEIWRKAGQAAPGMPDPAKVFRDCDDCPEMVIVPGGTFMMGPPEAVTPGGAFIERYPLEDEEGRHGSEGPQHEVTINRFAVGRYEVTIDEWNACHRAGGCSRNLTGVGHEKVHGMTDRGSCPVMYPTWDDAKEYVAWLSQVTGETYRLLTEAEWEYAARAGTTTAYHWGDAVGYGNANCDGCDRTRNNWGPAPTGSFAPNGFGLYDMSGNVWEWVEDCWHDSYENAPTDGSAWGNEDGGNCNGRVLRGGSWADRPKAARSATRGGWWRDGNRDYFGLRVARTLD